MTSNGIVSVIVPSGKSGLGNGLTMVYKTLKFGIVELIQVGSNLRDSTHSAVGPAQNRQPRSRRAFTGLGFAEMPAAIFQFEV